MRRTIPTWICRLGLAALLAGCAVAPARYYSLAAPATDQPAHDEAGATKGRVLRLSVARIPPEVERPQLIVRDPAREPAVQVLNDSLWAAPLTDQIRDVLAGAVSRRLGATDAQRLSEVKSAAARRIDVRVDRFDMIWGRFVALDASWSDRAPGAGKPRLCQASVRLPAADGVAGLVQAQRQALDRLAELIAAVASGHPTDLQGKSVMSEFGCT